MTTLEGNGHGKQDLFAILLNKEIKDGYFVEIGSHHPITNNNTYLMEAMFGWKGIMVEYNQRFLPLYQQFRPQSLHILNDATQVDYRKILDENNFPPHFNYLQIDLDVNNRSTLSTLELFDTNVFDKYKFGTVTFEHDIYNGDFFNTREASRSIFEKRGYIRLFSDVSVFWPDRWSPFEDWYAHPDIVDPVLIEKILKNPNNKSGIKCTECIDVIKEFYD